MVSDYIRETVFAGTRTGSVGVLNGNEVKQAYSVGSSAQLIKFNDNLF